MKKIARILAIVLSFILFITMPYVSTSFVEAKNVLENSIDDNNNEFYLSNSNEIQDNTNVEEDLTNSIESQNNEIENKNKEELLQVQSEQLENEVTGESSYEDFQYELVDNFVKITGYTGVGSDLVIPNEIEGKTVKYIGDSVFSNCYELTSIILPDSVIEIGEYAFYSCSNLLEVKLGKI